MKKVKKLCLALLLIGGFGLTACGDNSIYGTYKFEMGKVNSTSTHFGVYLTLTDQVPEPVKAEGWYQFSFNYEFLDPNASSSENPSSESSSESSSLESSSGSSLESSSSGSSSLPQEAYVSYNFLSPSYVSSDDSSSGSSSSESSISSEIQELSVKGNYLYTESDNSLSLEIVKIIGYDLDIPSSIVDKILVAKMIDGGISITFPVSVVDIVRLLSGEKYYTVTIDLTKAK